MNTSPITDTKKQQKERQKLNKKIILLMVLFALAGMLITILYSQ